MNKTTIKQKTKNRQTKMRLDWIGPVDGQLELRFDENRVNKAPHLIFFIGITFESD